MIINANSLSSANYAPKIYSDSHSKSYNSIHQNDCFVNSVKKNSMSFAGGQSGNGVSRVIAILGDFDRKLFDINGDRIPDLSHEETISRIAKAYNPDCQILPVKIQSYNDDSGKFDLDQTVGKLNKLADKIENKEKIDAVSLSLGKEYSIDLIKECSGIPISNDKLDKYKAKLKDWLKKPELSLAAKTIIEYKCPGQSAALIQELSRQVPIVEAIERITSKGVPVFVSAGNQGPDYFNILSLADNVITVGGVDSNGKIEPFSAKNSLIDTYTKSVFNISMINNKDYDITGQGNIEVLAFEVSNEEPEVKPYIGKKVSEVRASQDDYEFLVNIINNTQLIRKIKRMPLYQLEPDQADLAKKIKGVSNYEIGCCFDEHLMRTKSARVVFPINSIANLYGLSQQEVSNLKDKGQYVNASLNLVFKVDKEGKLVYDPDNSGRPAINKIFGTSLALPKAIAQYFEKKS